MVKTNGQCLDSLESNVLHSCFPLERRTLKEVEMKDSAGNYFEIGEEITFSKLNIRGYILYDTINQYEIYGGNGLWIHIYKDHIAGIFQREEA